MAFAFDQLNHKTAMVLRAYVTAVCQEGHPYSEVERIRDAIKEYFEDTFGCWGSDEGLLWFSFTVPLRNSSPIDPPKGIRNTEALVGSRGILMEHTFLLITLSVTRIIANVYEIYPQLDEPHTCCVTKLLVFIRWIVMQQGRQLQPEEFLFHKLSIDDIIEPDKLFSVIQASNLLNKYAGDAGLMDHQYNRLDTHCFRRGGAQHRFIHAQDPWSIKVVK